MVIVFSVARRFPCGGADDEEDEDVISYSSSCADAAAAEEEAHIARFDMVLELTELTRCMR